jgi:nucleotide-binding universal stress UspA family protein
MTLDSVPIEGEAAVSTDEVPAGGVLVGVDGSEASLQAMDWAVAEATARGSTLAVCCVAVAGDAEQPMLWNGQDCVMVKADEIVQQAVERARKSAPDLPVTGEVVFGDPAQQLLHRAHEAELVVLGARGLGAFVSLLVGSVSERVTARATRPVVVVRGQPSPNLPVLVGVDGSAANRAAVEFAFAAAARRRVELVALSAAEPRWITPAIGSPAPLALDIDGIEEEVRARLDDTLRPWTDRYPDLNVRRVAVAGGAAAALIRASSDASLAVVGSRGHGALAGALLGSVGRHVLHHAECPVAVVHS